jgi:hypothetical protein
LQLNFGVRRITTIIGTRAFLMRTSRLAYALVAVITMYGTIGCRWGEEARLGATSLSPDSAYVARYYQVAGGGAAGFVAQVVDVRSTAEAFNWSRWRDEAVFVASHKSVGVRWVGARHLEVEYADYNGNGAGDPPSTAVPRRGAISLSYRPAPERSKEDWERAASWVQLPPR